MMERFVEAEKNKIALVFKNRPASRLRLPQPKFYELKNELRHLPSKDAMKSLQERVRSNKNQAKVQIHNGPSNLLESHCKCYLIPLVFETQHQIIKTKPNNLTSKPSQTRVDAKVEPFRRTSSRKRVSPSKLVVKKSSVLPTKYLRRLSSKQHKKQDKMIEMDNFAPKAKQMPAAGYDESDAVKFVNKHNKKAKIIKLETPSFVRNQFDPVLIPKTTPLKVLRRIPPGTIIELVD